MYNKQKSYKNSFTESLYMWKVFHFGCVLVYYFCLERKERKKKLVRCGMVSYNLLYAITRRRKKTFVIKCTVYIEKFICLFKNMTNNFLFIDYIRVTIHFNASHVYVIMRRGFSRIFNFIFKTRTYHTLNVSKLNWISSVVEEYTDYSLELPIIGRPILVMIYHQTYNSNQIHFLLRLNFNSRENVTVDTQHSSPNCYSDVCTFVTRK